MAGTGDCTVVRDRFGVHGGTVSAHRQPSTWRALRTELRDLGARPCRVTGSHETWRFEDGSAFVIVRNHLGRTVPTGILATFRRLRQCRISAHDEDPLPRELTRASGLRQLTRSRKDWIMSKGNSGGKGGTKGGSSSNNGGGGTEGNTGNGGNWPSTTGNPSGGGRGNGPPK